MNRGNLWSARLTLFVVILAFVSAASAAVDLPSPVGTPPNASVTRWVRLLVIGNTVEPPNPVVWISPQSFETNGLNQPVFLSREEYITFLSFARSYGCLHALVGYPSPRTLLVTGYSSGRTNDFCILPRAEGCKFLYALMNLRKIRWSQAKRMPIRNLSASMACLSSFSSRDHLR